MEQAELRQWEHKCVQEEVPQCVAACPLHVDARTFCSLLAQRRWDKAWQVLAKTLPLPGVLSRLCDGPCKHACVRKDAGGSIEMDRLERFCAETAKPVAPPRPLPKRGKSVAVVGDGLTALCAAWEMARRGFDVTLHCFVPGGLLSALPEGVLERELENLVKLGVTIEDGVDLTSEAIDVLMDENDAVFVDGEFWPVHLSGVGEPDELTLGTQRVGLFAGPKGETSAVLLAAAGRRAANSVERFTQGVSMVTGRELEGPYATRLFTSLAKVESVPPVVADGIYTEETGRDEARRCLQCECMECVKHCEYLKHYKFYPKVYARQIYNNESIVMGTRQANSMINSCMLCGLCETLCPEDFSMADVCLEARRTMVESDTMPPSAHEFALRDMAFANSEKCVLARHAPGLDQSEYLFFPGCQLTASNPDSVQAAYADLRKQLGSVGLLLHCCGAPAEWSGRQGLMNETVAVLRKEWEALGSPKIIAACPTCLKTLHAYLPDAEVVSHWSILRALGLPTDTAGDCGSMAINDPCAARHNAMLREDVRAILEQVGVTVEEPEMTGETAQCCGYGGLLSEANPELGRAVAERRAAEMEEDWVTYCVMCRDMIAKTGKRAVHIYDLLYLQDVDAGARPSPGYSLRRENRARLRERLLAEIWQENGALAVEPYESVAVDFTAEASVLMEERRILKSDVQKVFLNMQKSGRRFISRENGHFLTSFRPVVVTYWVEFSEQGEGYLVHNVWSHRMKVREVRS
ncbi:pyridine nucleotide-disulfide oxidoreductase/dicluster-binding protein [uncultured Pseudodesulfovibrio sp.]|uniref:pyridine nucleotide-disulfide oxidoreductase/dicluster-binding protein n=1 Tax=uncultured Pseudodesulfovibrio sp. TaxID=2035858 RepID=UPI0029C75EF6|nr:pyridine nucleotide-disulfide oxidoreductase/dicluster-binding protein [uncultured Pseudodesulfovibrio sp.]